MTSHLHRILACALIAGCGRGFYDNVPDAPPKRPVDAPPVVPLAHAGTFAVQADSSVTTSIRFSARATHTRDAIVIYTVCGGTYVPTGVSIAAQGWQFVPLSGQIDTMSIHAASFGAIAPNTQAADFAVDWTMPFGCQGTDVVADEFTGTDPVNPFDTPIEAATCSGTTMAPPSAGGAVWAACAQVGAGASPGSGFSAGADDGLGVAAWFAQTDTARTITVANASLLSAVNLLPPH